MKKLEGKKKLIFLLIAVLVIGGLLIFSVLNAVNENGELVLNGLVRSETMYIIAVVLLSIPILLVLLIFAAAFWKKDR